MSRYRYQIEISVNMLLYSNITEININKCNIQLIVYSASTPDWVYVLRYAVHHELFLLFED